jgi:hypothetical protein
MIVLRTWWGFSIITHKFLRLNFYISSDPVPHGGLADANILLLKLNTALVSGYLGVVYALVSLTVLNKKYH